jgi:hypothetical protein
MDDGLWSWWEEMREQARNLTEELRFGARPPIGVTSWQNGRLKVNFGLLKWKKCLAMSTGVGRALPLIPHAPAELVGFATAENSTHRSVLRCSNTSDEAAPGHHRALAFSVRATCALGAAFKPASPHC